MDLFLTVDLKYEIGKLALVHNSVLEKCTMEGFEVGVCFPLTFFTEDKSLEETCIPSAPLRPPRAQLVNMPLVAVTSYKLKELTEMLEMPFLDWWIWISIKIVKETLSQN